MLNVNKMRFSIIFIMVFSCNNTYSADFDKVDILKVRLGASSEDVSNIVKNRPCEKANFSHSIAGFTGMRISCNTNQQYGFGLNVIFDHNRKVIEVSRNVNFTQNPDYEDIKQKLISKYGNADYTAKSTSSTYGYGKELCWGDCRLEKTSDGWRGTKLHMGYKGKALLTRLNYFKSSSQIYNLEFTLRDYKARKRNDEWIESMERENKSRLRKSESNFDL